MMDSYMWAADYDQVTEFGAYLARQLAGPCADGINVEILQEYYKKPWHWTADREALLAEREAGRPDPDLDRLYDLARGGGTFPAAQPYEEDYREERLEARETAEDKL